MHPLIKRYNDEMVSEAGEDANSATIINSACAAVAPHFDPQKNSEADFRLTVIRVARELVKIKRSPSARASLELAINWEKPGADELYKFERYGRKLGI